MGSAELPAADEPLPYEDLAGMLGGGINNTELLILFENLNLQQGCARGGQALSVSALSLSPLITHYPFMRILLFTLSHRSRIPLSHISYTFRPPDRGHA